jgi:hypothetical protein
VGLVSLCGHQCAQIVQVALKLVDPLGLDLG